MEPVKTKRTVQRILMKRIFRTALFLRENGVSSCLIPFSLLVVKNYRRKKSRIEKIVFIR